MNEESPIFRSLAMIEEKIQERITVEMLAEGVHFSKYHYQRLFREAVGDTVMRYVTRRKLSLAAGELVGTEDSVLDIALRYGYDSHEGFARSFKAHFGVAPTEYRKYHSAIRFLGGKKEECSMVYSKAVEELVKELNSLIVQAKETVANTRKYQKMGIQAAAFYGQVWELAAERTERMAEKLKGILERVDAAAQGMDEISARFLLVKAIDDAAFEANVTAFQVGLMISRAMPEHRMMFQPLCAQYGSLAQDARIKSRKMADFLKELSYLIVQDMEKEARQKLQSAAASGREAAKKLSDPTLPYGYIADAAMAIAEKAMALAEKVMAIAEKAMALAEKVMVLADKDMALAEKTMVTAEGSDSLALEDVTLSDAVFQLETICFAADMDILRAPQHRQLFDGLLDFKKKLEEAEEYLQNLIEVGMRALEKTENKPEEKCAERKFYNDLAMQEGVVLFYLKGEIQKLGGMHLDAGQKAALDAVCSKVDLVIKMAHGVTNKGEKDKIESLLCEACIALEKEAEKLAQYGGAVQYLAEEMKKPLGYVENKVK